MSTQRQLTEEEMRRVAEALQAQDSARIAAQRGVSMRGPSEQDMQTVASGLNAAPPPPEMQRDNGAPSMAAPPRGQRAPVMNSGPNDQELLAVARGMNPDPTIPEMQRDNGGTIEPNPNWRGQRAQIPAQEAPAPRGTQAPPAAVARQPGPAPAAIASEAGAGPNIAGAPADEPSGERLPPEQDRPAFDYLPHVEAGVREAMRRGRTDIAARIQGEYGVLVEGQFRAMETQYEKETLPQVHAMRKQLLAYQQQAMPKELAMKARELAGQASAQQRRMLAFSYGLERNALTAGMGIKLFNESQLIEPGVKLDRFEVQGENLVGLDAKGQPVKLLNGQPFVIPVAQAEQLYADEFGDSKNDTEKLGEGDVLVDKATGEVRASNPKSGSSTSSEVQGAVKVGTSALARRLGIELDATGRLMEGVNDQTRQTWLELSAQVESKIAAGMSPQQAAMEVWNTYSGSQAAKQGGGGEYTGPSIQSLMTGSN